MIAWFSQEARKNKEKFILFLDRDGVINRDSPDFVRKWEDVIIYPDAVEGLRRACGLGARLVIVSNQSGIGRGYISFEDFWDIHRKIAETFAHHNIHFSAAVYCPHHPSDSCLCRKPSPEMILFILNVLGLSPDRSFFIGDRISDMEAASRAGCRGIMLCRNDSPDISKILPKGEYHLASNLIEAVINIEKLLR
ncbi:MAG: HAD family hydrolase [Thermodesulforhabdaceae bacterium]